MKAQGRARRERLHLLGLEELRLQTSLLGHIGGGEQPCLATLEDDGVRGDVHFAVLPAFCTEKRRRAPHRTLTGMRRTTLT